ncbi:MAG: hypothetical protein PHW54_01195 [Candidatus Omnitrophica bacterium]|nr:hypothetical protein [Candidatus Omnitrophota bacterium]
MRNLRGQGWSLGEIGLKIRIPKNTLSGWVKDIKLSEKQKERIRQKIISSGAIGRPLAVKTNREKMEKWKERIKARVKHFGKYALNNPETGKLICGLLYLCEGAKYPASRFLHFGNSESGIIYFFINLLRKSYSIDENKLRFSISYRYDQNYEDLKNYWSNLIGVPKSKCLNSKPDTRTKGKPTQKKDYKGICRIIYYDTSLQFELQSIGDTIIKGRF